MNRKHMGIVLLMSLLNFVFLSAASPEPTFQYNTKYTKISDRGRDVHVYMVNYNPETGASSGKTYAVVTDESGNILTDKDLAEEAVFVAEIIEAINTKKSKITYLQDLYIKYLEFGAKIYRTRMKYSTLIDWAVRSAPPRVLTMIMSGGTSVAVEVAKLAKDMIIEDIREIAKEPRKQAIKIAYEYFSKVEEALEFNRGIEDSIGGSILTYDDAKKYVGYEVYVGIYGDPCLTLFDEALNEDPIEKSWAEEMISSIFPVELVGELVMEAEEIAKIKYRATQGLKKYKPYQIFLEKTSEDTRKKSKYSHVITEVKGEARDLLSYNLELAKERIEKLAKPKQLNFSSLKICGKRIEYNLPIKQSDLTNGKIIVTGEAVASAGIEEIIMWVTPEGQPEYMDATSKNPFEFKYTPSSTINNYRFKFRVVDKNNEQFDSPVYTINYTPVLKEAEIKISGVKIGRYDVRDATSSLNLTEDDLKDGSIEINAKIDDGANGDNIKNIQINVGRGWVNLANKVDLSYRFKPEKNRDYRLEFKVTDLSGKAHESSFGTFRLGYKPTPEKQEQPQEATVTFSNITIAKHKIEDISGKLVLTKEDLVNGELVIEGRVDDRANGANLRSVEIDIGDGWKVLPSKVSLHYRFKPEENQTYRLTFRAEDLSLEMHKSKDVFGIPQFVYQYSKKISITFPQIRIADNNVENISGTLSLTQNDLKNGEIEIRGRIEDGANGANTQKVQIDVGDGWHDAQGRVNWKYSFKPRESQKYNLRFRAIDLEGREHESLFTSSLICQSQQRGEDDEALIRRVVYDWETAYKNEDLNKYLSYLADDYEYEPQHWDKGTERTVVSRDFKRYDPIGTMDLKILSVKMQGNNRATVRYDLYQVRSDTTTGLQAIDDEISEVDLERRDGNWLIVRERNIGTKSDNTAPRVVSTTPADGATGVSTTTPIVIRFNEPMGSYVIFGLWGGGANSDNYTFSSYDKNTYTFTFSNVTALPSGESIRIQIQESFRDAYGNSVETTEFTFTTQ